MKTIHLEQLLGREVRDADGKKLGPIEELIAEGATITEVHVGRAAMAERLSAHGVAMTFLGLFGAHGRSEKPHRIKWRDLDLSDPEHPRLKR